MPFHRRQLLQAAIAAVVVSQRSVVSAAGRPVRLLVGFPAGGGTDALARLLAAHLRSELGVDIVVDNRPGAGGQLAAQALKAAAPDGKTLFLSHDHTISIVPKVIRVPGFDPNVDFVPVAGVATFVNAFAVTAAHPARTFADYEHWLKQQAPEQLAVGIPAPASTPEFLVNLLAQRNGVALQPIPYRGSAPMIADLLGGQVPAGIGSVQDFMELHRTGRLRVVGVLGAQRQPALPDVPTFSEMGVPGFEDPPFYGLYAPAGLPAELVARWETAVQKVLQIPQVRQQMQDWGMVVDYMNHNRLRDVEAAYSQTWGRIIAQLGYEPQ
ncbi:Twin-arginine translocation pathway signal [Lampropedia cohaerens]|uniref:Twin-arginine translocation pathway signal n=1 Tax=Lampropedia cohaerens TaxID=1610491 RepID=A0A0U1Q2U9_9BURK|nr:tripartite tricarboxylate transporter substrate-binding protein [Lampropedia cohaerens]KKW69077.1 Twin-arginine translocation pathway signal [Lampropedia cohaerens]